MKEANRRRIWSYGILVGLELLLIGVILFLWARDILSVRETISYFLFGVGAISLFDVLARYAQLAPRRFMWCRLMFAFLLLSTGGAVLGGIGNWWPLILILVGVGILVNALLSLIRK
jgi:hypothetical protein